MNRLLRYMVLLLFSIKLAGSISAQEFIPLWATGKKPNQNGIIVTDTTYNERIWRVGNPGLYAFIVPPGDNKGAAIMIIPGGGYERISHIYNGFNLAKWYNTIGVSAFVLIYRLPHQRDLVNRQLAPLQDAQRGMQYIRANCRQWNIQANKIGVMGTSAGGHLAALLGNTEYPDKIGDEPDSITARPDFMVLLSPVITMGAYTHRGSKKNFLGADTSASFINKFSNEKNVNINTPVTFITHALDDSTVSVRNSLLFYNALLDKKINASLHIFPNGGHNIRINDNPGSTDLWLGLLERWMKETNIIVPKKSQ